jgi:hypothetical protein
MTLVHPDESSITDCCLKEIVPERLPGAIISSVCAVISPNLIGSIHTIHEIIVHVNEIRNLKALEWLISECLFDPFVLCVWPLSHPRNSGRSVNKCCHKQNNLGILPCELKHLFIGGKAAIKLSPSDMI